MYKLKLRLAAKDDSLLYTPAGTKEVEGAAIDSLHFVQIGEQALGKVCMKNGEEYLTFDTPATISRMLRLFN